MTDVGEKSPCIGVCSTTFGDVVCRGCKRFAHEVIDWNAYGRDEKRAVLARLHAFRKQVVDGKLEVFDLERLRAQLARYRVPHEADADAHELAWQLIRYGARRIQRVEAYGVRRRPAYRGVALTTLRERIDAELQALSEGHYERFFAPAPAALASGAYKMRD